MKFLCISSASDDAPVEANKSNRLSIWYNSIRKGLKRNKEPRVTISEPIRIETLTQSDLIQINGVIEVKPSGDDNNDTTKPNTVDVNIESGDDTTEDQVDAAIECNNNLYQNASIKPEKPTSNGTTKQQQQQQVVTPTPRRDISPPSTPETTEQIVRYAWFWGNISRREAENLLRGKKDGSFLVRASSDKRFLYSLSFRSNGKTMHTRIEYTNGLYFFYSNESSSNRDSDGTSSLGGLISVAMNQNNADSVFFYSRGLRTESSLHTVSLNQPISRHQYLLDYPYEHSDNKALQYMCKFIIRHSPKAHSKLEQQLHSLPVGIDTFINNDFYFPRKAIPAN